MLYILKIRNVTNINKLVQDKIKLFFHNILQHVTDIFGAVYIDPVAKNGGPFVPKDWKKYRDDTWDLEDHASEQQVETFTRT